MSFLVNPDSKALEAASIGDTVYLKFDDFRHYKVETLVTNIDADEITGTVVSIIDYDENAQLLTSDVNELLQNVLIFRPEHVFKIIKSRRAGNSA